MFLLSVDSSDENYELHHSTWEKHGIISVRATNMQQAVERMNENPFTIIDINADSIDYKSQLRIVCEYSTAPVQLLTSRYDDDESVFAYLQGAALYSKWCNTPENNVLRDLIFAGNYINRNTKPQASLKFISFKNLRLYLKCRTAVIGDVPIDLTQREFDILSHLIQNKDCIVSHSELYVHAWKDCYDESCTNRIRMQICRLRDKLSGATDFLNCIETIKDTGYRLTTRKK